MTSIDSKKNHNHIINLPKHTLIIYFLTGRMHCKLSFERKLICCCFVFFFLSCEFGRVRILIAERARTTLALASRVRSKWQMRVNGLPDVCLPRFRLLKFKGLGSTERVSGQSSLSSHYLYFVKCFMSFKAGGMVTFLFACGDECTNYYILLAEGRQERWCHAFCW